MKNAKWKMQDGKCNETKSDVRILCSCKLVPLRAASKELTLRSEGDR